MEESKSGGSDLERELETLRRRLQQAEALAVSTQAQLDSVVASQREEAAAAARGPGATSGTRRPAQGGGGTGATGAGVKLGAFEAEHVTAAALASGGTTEAVPETEEDIARRRRREWIMSGQKGRTQAQPETGSAAPGTSTTAPPTAASGTAAGAGSGGGGGGRGTALAAASAPGTVSAASAGSLASGTGGASGGSQVATHPPGSAGGTGSGATGGGGTLGVVTGSATVPPDAATAAASPMVQVPMDVLSQTLAAAVSAGAAQAHQAQWQAQAAAAASAGDYYSSGYGYYGTEYQYPAADGAAGVVGAYDPSAAAAWGAGMGDHQSPHAAATDGGTGEWSRLYDEQSG